MVRSYNTENGGEGGREGEAAGMNEGVKGKPRDAAAGETRDGQPSARRVIGRVIRTPCGLLINQWATAIH